MLEEGLGLLWRQRSAEAVADFLKQWCQYARDTGIRQMQQLAKPSDSSDMSSVGDTFR